MTKPLINVKHLAKLAQMTVSPSEAKILKKGFDSTLKTISLLNQLDTSKLSSTFQVTGLTNVFRKDKIDKSSLLTQKQALSGAKKTYQGYFVVPFVFHET